MANSTILSHNFERSFDTNSAIVTVKRYAESMHLNLSCQSVGTSLTTCSCEITDSTGYSTIGRGKGLGDQSMASAIFEAIEHYYYEIEETSDLSSLKLDFEGIDGVLREAAPDLGLIFGTKRPSLKRLLFTEINGDDQVWFPAVLMNPKYKPSDLNEAEIINNYRLKRYSTNSGTASGLNLPDSCLHGLLEVIERDAIGVELLGTVIKSKPSQVREIDATSLPKAVKNIYDLASAESGGALTLWDITSDLGVPTILCALTIGDPPMFRFFGSGCSLSGEYAIERAILEALQGFHIQTYLNVPLQQAINPNLRWMSLYQKCNLECGYFFYRGGEKRIGFSDIGTGMYSKKNLTTEQQLVFLTDRLKAMGIKTYYRTIQDRDIYVTQVLAPALERFHLVAHGITIAPSARGKRILYKT